MGSSIKISTSEIKGWLVVNLSGRLDALTADQTLQAMLACISADNPKIAADASGLEYMSSAGIRTLLLAAKGAARVPGGAFAVLNPSPVVRKILAESGLDALLGVTGELPEPV
ncbi:MAG: STAS domain-containing protein [Opitutales bacterium]|jgi:anti-sigma B factor antagonist